jgi:hypothetical protein
MAVGEDAASWRLGLPRPTLPRCTAGIGSWMKEKTTMKSTRFFFFSVTQIQNTVNNVETN